MSDLNVALILKLIDHVTGPSKAVLAAMRQVSAAVDGAGRGMIEQGNRLEQIAEDQRNKALGSAAATGAMAAGVGLAFKKMFLDTATEFERYQTILETVEGSSDKAAASMDWVSDFAAKTPYALGEVTDAFVQLRAYGLDPQNGLLKTLGDTSAAMGRPIMQAVEAIADAVTGENERLKEFGITSAIEGQNVIYSYTDKAGKELTATVDKNNRALIQSTLMAIWNEKYDGAADKLSETWEGMIANLGDQWTRFARKVMGAGVFDAMKANLKGLLDWVNAAAEDGRLQAWARTTADAMLQFGAAVGNVARGVSEVAAVMAPIIQPMREWAAANPELVASIGQLVAYMAALKVGFIALRLASVLFLGPLGGIFRWIGWLLRGLTALGLTNPFVLLAAAAVAAIWVIYDNWGNIGNYFRGKWNEVKAAVEEGWVQGIWTMFREFNPVTLVNEAIVGLVAYVGEKFAEIGRLIDDTLSGIDLYDAGKAIIQSLWNGAVALVAQMVADIKGRLADMMPDRPWWLGGGDEAPAPDPGGVVAQNRPPITTNQVNGGNTVTNVGDIIVNSPAADPKQVAREVKNQIAQAGKAGSRGPKSLFDEPEDTVR